MKILLDECLPKRLKRVLPTHEVRTVPEMGWAGIQNGQLLTLAQAQFDVFVTADQNLQHQQNLAGRTISVIILVAPNNRFESLSPLTPAVEAALPTIQPGTFVRIP